MDLQKFCELRHSITGLPDAAKLGQESDGSFCELRGLFNGRKSTRLNTGLKHFVASLPSQRGSQLRQLKLSTETVGELRTTLHAITTDTAFLQTELKTVSEIIKDKLADTFTSQEAFTHFLHDSEVKIRDFLKHCQHSSSQAEFAAKLQRFSASLTLNARSELQSDSYQATADLINGLIANSVTQPPVNYILLHTPLAENGPPFYIEPQKKHFCPFHAANAFLGKPMLPLTGSGDPMDGEEFLPFLKQALSEADPTATGIKAEDITLTSAVMSQQLANDLDAMTSDRIIIGTGLSSHFVCFRRSKDGHWYKLDSDRYQFEQERDSPGHYLQNIYRQGHTTQEENIVTLIHLKGEQLTTGFE
ncbi:hypothetical protein EOPP23_19585 [Endozoicomonas sp. OPT23]|uniref:hypothetical protein n=1 Tax=Endozoicomonas sp. OPT23 TaxID=2072845 RepID=UPI00129A0FE7|nr:hypothetical protein [Endozoicomonas sp. OPT23]MRI35173.1 hypothetical protein [Endozoicomonas sp. OPT23]